MSSTLTHEQQHPETTSTAQQDFQFVDKITRQKHGESCPRPQIVSSSEFDTGFRFAPKEVQVRGQEIISGMAKLGYDLLEFRQLGTTAVENEARPLLEKIHAAAAILHTQWEKMRMNRDKIGEQALARLFNGMTKAAREVHERTPLFDTTHLETLAESLRTETEPKAIADALYRAARQRTHEKAWAWVVLPTFPDENYGRILLLKIETNDSRYPIIVTQPTFLSGRGTQFHTHGHNRAFAAPLGNGDDIQNQHINSIWQATSEKEVFPLKIQSRTYYDNSQVAMIPPKEIHGVTKAHSKPQQILSLEELAAAGQPTINQVVSSAQFGEGSCLHIYAPDWETVKEFADSPFVEQNPKFWEDNDMIVFNTSRKDIWTGGGGAFTQRVIEASKTGDHCGACFIENDPRQEHLDPEIVASQYLSRGKSKAEVFSYNRQQDSSSAQ